MEESNYSDFKAPGQILRIIDKKVGAAWDVGDLVTLKGIYAYGRSRVSFVPHRAIKGHGFIRRLYSYEPARLSEYINYADVEVKINALAVGYGRNLKEDREMNKTVAKLFDKTADAVLVDKHYGGIIDCNDIEYIILNGKQAEILAAAKAREEEVKR